MDINLTQEYWLEESREALTVAGHLFEKGDYSYALFFGHLAVEKILKALYVSKTQGHPPYIHNLLRLAEQTEIPLSNLHRDQLIRITAYNLESRYPDERRSFRRKCDQDFTRKEMDTIKGVFEWLKSMLP
jgi:HEPN domain-containing protein